MSATANGFYKNRKALRFIFDVSFRDALKNNFMAHKINHKRIFQTLDRVYFANGGRE